MICPICKRRLNKSHFACQSGSKGGKAGKGEAKARTAEQAKKAVTIRWEKWAANEFKRAKLRKTE